MKKQEITEIIIDIVADFLQTQGTHIEINEETALFGDKAVLDSMGLVNIVIDLESTLLDKGMEISLTSENAMSRRQSPFRSVSSLADFICEQLS